MKRPVLWSIAALGGALALTLATMSGRAGAVPPIRLGINLSTPAYWAEARSFSNLALYGPIRMAQLGEKQVTIDPALVGPSGWPANISGNMRAYLALLIPQGAKEGAVFQCSWQGHATVALGGDAFTIRSKDDGIAFSLRKDGPDSRRDVAKPAKVYLIISDVSPSAPMENVDCREYGRPRTLVYDPGFLQSLAPYRVVRFMDWMNVNGEPTADFTRETRLERPRAPDSGFTLASMIELVNDARVDPWFTIPYGADDDYITRFAQMTHDRLPPDRTVYVELGNEIWNLGFSAARRAKTEGTAAGLSANPYEAQLLQYALRSKHMLDIWTRIYADRPKRLVRVVSVQHVNAWGTAKILSYRDVAKSIDAVAVAPYFGHKVYPKLNSGPRPTSIDDAFDQLKPAVDAVMAAARAQKEVTDRFGKRLIAYEGGQHVVIPDDPALLRQINSDPRMGQLYTMLLDEWARQIGDTFVLYSQVGPVGSYGAWGLAEYDNESLDKAPKLKAVLDFAAGHRPPAP